MKNFKLHLIVIGLVVVSELIGIISYVVLAVWLVLGFLAAIRILERD